MACESSTAPTSDFDSNRYPYRVSAAGVRLFGTSRVLVIPTRYYGGPPMPLTSAELQQQLFGGPGGGPVNQAFSAASDGGFRLLGHVTNWVQATVSVNQPGSGIYTPTAAEDYVFEAMLGVDGEVDFGQYDNDGADGFPNSGDDDGIVDGGVAILNSELNRYCNGGTGLGPHPFANRNWRPNGQRYQTTDPRAGGGVIEVGGYTLMSAIGCGGRTAAAHVLAHELGHLLLGLPDLYHAVPGQGEVWATRRWVIGCWELMSAAAWGCATGAPTPDYRFNTLGAWTRTQLDWATVSLANTVSDATYELHPLGRGSTILRVPIQGQSEYLLIEYREATAADPKLPANGVLIYHVAEQQPTQNPSTLQGSYRVSLIEADDDSTLLRTELQGGNRGTASDAFGITRTSLRPGEHSRAKAIDGVPFGFQITEITIDAAAHRARLRISPVPVIGTR